MTVPEPKPMEPWARHPDADDGFPRLGILELRLGLSLVVVVPVAHSDPHWSRRPGGVP